MQISTVFEIRRKNVEVILKFYESRHAFAEKISTDYNLLNQYLSHKKPKRIGEKLAGKITTAHNLPEGWLDSLHDEATIRNIIQGQSTTKVDAENTKKTENYANHPSVDSSSHTRMIGLNNTLIMSRGEKLSIAHNTDLIKNINIPEGIKNPVAYVIKGIGYAKPYRNGYVVICEYVGVPIAGEEVLIFMKNGDIYAGEYLFEQDILISIDSVEGKNEKLHKDDIARISPVKVFVSPSQLLV